MEKSTFDTKIEHPFDSIEKPKSKLTFLLVSDIHNATKRLEKLKNWEIEINKEPIHYVLVLGDSDNIDNNDPITKSTLPGQLENVISNILKFLEFFSVPIIYIPGNHDAPTLFTADPPSLTPYSTNIHLKAYKVADDLQLIGLGGSLCGYIIEDDSNKTRKEVWNPYPYDEEHFKNDLNELISKYISKEIQTILLTHNGPSGSSTTIQLNSSNSYVPIYTGSDFLAEILKTNELNILANFHGHTHVGVGKSNIDKIQIINPGSLSDGNFAIVKFCRNIADNAWSLRSTEFINLNTF